MLRPGADAGDSQSGIAPADVGDQGVVHSIDPAQAGANSRRSFFPCSSSEGTGPNDPSRGDGGAG